MVRLTVRVTTDQQGSSVQNVFKSIIRVLIRYPGLGDSIPCATQAKFRVGISHIDNWSADEIDALVDFTTGQLTTHFMTGRVATFAVRSSRGVNITLLVPSNPNKLLVFVLLNKLKDVYE
jgi:hypothetical protein